MAGSLETERSRLTNENRVENHFEMLRKTPEENDLLDDAERIFNVNKGDINMELKQGKVIIKKSSKNINSLIKDSPNRITVNCCVNAAGHVLTPVIIYEKSISVSSL